MLSNGRIYLRVLMSRLITFCRTANRLRFVSINCFIKNAVIYEIKTTTRTPDKEDAIDNEAINKTERLSRRAGQFNLKRQEHRKK